MVLIGEEMKWQVPAEGRRSRSSIRKVSAFQLVADREPSNARVHKRGVSAGTSTVTDLPLTFRVGMAIAAPRVENPCSRWASVLKYTITGRLRAARRKLRLK